MIFISILVSILEATLEDAFMKCVKYSYNQMKQEVNDVIPHGLYR